MGEAYEFKVNRAGRNGVSYVLSSQGVSRASRYRSRIVPWERIRTLWTLKNSFILFYSDTGYWILPEDQIPAAARAFLLSKVQEVGIRTKSLVTSGMWGAN